MVLIQLSASAQRRCYFVKFIARSSHFQQGGWAKKRHHSSSLSDDSGDCPMSTCRTELLEFKFSNQFRHLEVSLATVNTNDNPQTLNTPNEEPTVNSEDTIPAHVLQYERQLRKVQANQRSLSQLSIQQHLKIIFEDEFIIVVDKPSGILCVPGLHNKPSLLDLICAHCHISKETSSSLIVHRLDMDTSGVVVFAKTDIALKKLQSDFRNRQVHKEYHALVCGHWMPEVVQGGHIHLPLQRDHEHPPFMRIATPESEMAAARAVQDLQTHGFQKLVKKRPKPSHTEFQILSREYLCTNELGTLPVTRLLLLPHTGRTHQLRVHCAALGHAIVSDPAYGLYGEANPRGGLPEPTPTTADDDHPREKPSMGASLELQKAIHMSRPPHAHNMCLHAAVLTLNHPITGTGMTWEAQTPF